MAIFIDTAQAEEARKAKEVGWFKGITINPVLLSASGHDSEETLRLFSDLKVGK